jgi:hypothetical protein
MIKARGLNPADVPIAADPSMWTQINDRKGYGVRRVESYQAAGLNMIRGDNARVDGWANIRLYLHQDRLRIYRGRCAALIRTMPLMVSSTHNVEDLDTTKEDHAVDSLRYLLNQRPLKAPPTPEALKIRAEADFARKVAAAEEAYRKRYL